MIWSLFASLIHSYQKETEYEKWVRQRNKLSQGKKGRHGHLGIIFLVFCYSSHLWLLRVTFSHLCCGAMIFGSSSAPTNFIFLFPVLHPFKQFFCLNFFQPIRACQPIAPYTFLFLTWESANIMTLISGTCCSFSHSFLPYYNAPPLSAVLNLSRICPSFFIVICLTSNLARKQLTTKTIQNTFSKTSSFYIFYPLLIVYLNFIYLLFRNGF